VIGHGGREEERSERDGGRKEERDGERKEEEGGRKEREVRKM